MTSSSTSCLPPLEQQVQALIGPGPVQTFGPYIPAVVPEQSLTNEQAQAWHDIQQVFHASMDGAEKGQDDD